MAEAPGASYDRGSMRLAAQRTADAGETINGIRSQILNNRDQLRATWDSEAARSFDRVVYRWDEECRNVLNALNDLREGLGASEVKYQVTDDEQNQNMTKIDSMINEL